MSERMTNAERAVYAASVARDVGEAIASLTGVFEGAETLSAVELHRALERMRHWAMMSSLLSGELFSLAKALQPKARTATYPRRRCRRRATGQRRGFDQCGSRVFTKTCRMRWPDALEVFSPARARLVAGRTTELGETGVVTLCWAANAEQHVFGPFCEAI